MGPLSASESQSDLPLFTPPGPSVCPACTLAASQTPALTETLGHAPVPKAPACTPQALNVLGLEAACSSPEGLGGRFQPALSPRRPQPYRTLKESDSAEGDEAESPEQQVRKPTGPVPAPTDRAASIDLLEDVFNNLDMEAALQPLGQAKSLEDLRAPKDLREQPGTFDYQVWHRQGRGSAGPALSADPHVTVEETNRETVTFQGPQPTLRVSVTVNPSQGAGAHTTLTVTVGEDARA